MSFTYWLPDEDGKKIEHKTSCNSVIIVGANGAGKSKLGAWIEKIGSNQVHRIGAQRNINFQENIPLKSYSQAESLVLYGREDGHDKGARWNWGHDTTTLLNDFDNVLAALIAKKNIETDHYMQQCREAERQSIDKPCVPTTILDKLQCIWNEVLPQRRLELEDSKFFASFEKDGKTIKYSATQMSDGERSVLYFAAQVLCVPDNKVLIMDEPELHLHRSIMNRLWIALERCRKDCLFIYITHDTQFAAIHPNSETIWIKEYDGTKWILEKIDGVDLPEELLLEILGSRKNVLFVEGERSSYDTQLYAELYQNYYVVPCGSCTQVIARTKAFRNSPSLHDCSVYGIIDRDYRSDCEIEKYKEDQIFIIDVAEVENLFVVEELIRLVALHMAKNPEEVFSQVQKYVIDERFANQIDSQILEATVAQIKYELMSAKISLKDEKEAKSSLVTAKTAIDFDAIQAEQEKKFKGALKSHNYSEVIRIFNNKRIATTVGKYFGINDKEYCSLIVALLHGDKHDDIVKAIVPYLPADIPMEMEGRTYGT